MKGNETVKRWPRVLALAILLLFVAMGIGDEVLEWSVHKGPSVSAVIPILFAVYPLVGALIIVRRGSHAIGWSLLAFGPIVLIMTGSQDYAGYALVLHPGSLPFGEAAHIASNTVWVAGFFIFDVVLPLTFPTGRLLSKRWRWVLALALAYIVVVQAGNLFIPGSTPGSPYPQIKNPLGITGHDDLWNNLQALSLLILLFMEGWVIAAVVVRYRRSRDPERQQLKWFFYSALLVPIPLALNNVPTWDHISFVAVLPLPAIAIGIAVLRYRLYDIDVVINRTLVYGALALFITAVYVAIVVGIGALIGSGGKPNLALSIVATAIVAVGFQPARERVQKVANRMVYGKRATPYEVLSQFSERVAESYASDDVLPRMARVLADGIGAERADVWLRAARSLRQAASWPADSPITEPILVTEDSLPGTLEADRAVEVRHQGELLGALTVTMRRGESLTPVEEKLLTDLASQAGLVLKNVRLRAELFQRLAELRASRQRLVAAQDEERRRLERNLHDGAQQNLVALKVKLGLALAVAARDPAKAKELVGQLKSDADEALETLRDLARGIYPPLLADRGLPAALEAQARKATLPVEVDADGIGRLPQDLEAAVYFCVLEALQNIQKYAEATHATVRLRGSDGELRFEVSDDGKGFDPATTKKGSGLTNMSDRLDALAGSLAISSEPGKCTLVAGTLPIPQVVASA